jgi:probable rRNA maturation factor
MIHLQISEFISPILPPTVMERAAKETLATANAPGEAELTILLTNDDQIQQLNREYLSIDEPTDVLAFPANYMDPDTKAFYLGDVIISFERAVVQAQAGAHALEHEIELLVVHGILHLLGHDHAGPDEKAKMWVAQAEILARLGNPIAPA